MAFLPDRWRGRHPSFFTPLEHREQIWSARYTVSSKKKKGLVVTALPPFNPDDLWQIKNLAQIALSPDGRRVAFVLESLERTKDEYHSALFLLHLNEQGQSLGEPRQIAQGLKSDTSLCWAPDSHRLLFLSNQDGRNQLWLIDTDDGAARKITNMPHGVNEAVWSPDSTQIAFTASVTLEDSDDLLTEPLPGHKILMKPLEAAKHPNSQSTGDALYHGEELDSLKTLCQLFVMPALSFETHVLDPQQIHRLTEGNFDHSLPTWTPDSQEIGVLRNRQTDHSPSKDLWVINPHTKVARCLTEGDLFITSYSWSPDGQAVLVTARKISTSQVPHISRLYLITRSGNIGDRTLLLTPDFDVSTNVEANNGDNLPGPYRPAWSRDGQQIYFLATQDQNFHLYCLAIVWRTLTQLTTNSRTSFIALFPNHESLLLAYQLEGQPWNLYRLPLSYTTDESPEQLTDISQQPKNEIESPYFHRENSGEIDS